MSEPTDTLYPWKRFWCPWDKPISFADDGFVYDPESEYGIILNPDLTTLNATVDLSCVILLGEPGLGKSETLRKHCAALDSEKDPSRRVMFVDLKDFGSDTALTRWIFESEIFQNWKKGEGRLYLLLDSFDEGLLTIKTLSGYLTRELQALTAVQPTLTARTGTSASSDASEVQQATDSVSSTVTTGESRTLDRLYLRIACRPATWPPSLTASLCRIFPKEAVSVLRLAPLRKSDVELAARHKGVPDFVSEVISRGVVPFATKPITLKALLSLYQSHQALPNSRREIYEELCRVASTESSKSRRERSKAGRLTPTERVCVAGRVAALMVFCNRSRLRTDLPLEGLGNEELGLDAVFGLERHKNDEIRVDSQTIGETLDSTLFSWPKSQCVAWDHRTYCEFLAAEYCHLHKIPPRQVSRLIFTTAFGERRIAPQLYETTAWLCSLYPSLLADVLASDPFVLLLSDVLSDDASIRSKVTDRYLESFEKERVFSDQIRDELRLLQRPHLPGQLRRYISQKTKKYRARTRAMDIAAVCTVREIEPDLIKVALDSRESLTIRTHALFTLGQYATSTSKALLRELVIKPCPEDQDKEIKGWALMATWPDHISAQELFAALTDPGPPNFVGGYASFLNNLSRDISAALKEADLDTALDWVERLDTDRHGANRMTAVADSVLVRAWDSLQNAAILDRFARIVLKRIENHVPIAQSDDVYRPGQVRRFYKLLTEGTINRRLLIGCLVRHLAAGNVTLPPFWLIASADRIVRTSDTGWLIEQLRTSTPEEDRIIEALLDGMPDDFESLNAFRRALDEGRLPSEYEVRLYIELSSELAASLKRQYEESAPRPRERKLLIPPPDLTDLLYQVEC